MWQFALPALQAVGINAGVNLLRRKPLFQNAGTAAVTGGVLGGFNGGGLFSSNPTAAAATPTSSVVSNSGVSNVLGSAAPSAVTGSTAFWQGANTAGVGGGLNATNAMGGIPGAGAFETLMGLDKAYNAGSLAGLPGSGTIESIMGQAGADGVYRDAGSFANIFGTPTYTGGEGLLSNAMSNIGDQFSDLGEYVTPKNLLGVSMLLNNMSDMPRPVAASGGGAQGGTPPKFEPFVTGQVYGRKKRGNA